MSNSDTCKVCGASRNPVAASCQHCGTFYQSQSLVGEDYVKALQMLLIGIESESPSDRRADQIVTAIQTFSVPNDVENLLVFLHYCHSNGLMRAVSDDDDKIKHAWKTKAKSLYDLLKIKSLNNPGLDAHIKGLAEYESFGRESIFQRFLMSQTREIVNMPQNVLLALSRTIFVPFKSFKAGCLTLFIILFFITWVGDYFANRSPEYKMEKDRLEEIVIQIDSAIDKNDITTAKNLLHKLYWDESFVNSIKGKSHYEELRKRYLKRLGLEDESEAKIHNRYQ